MRPTRSFRAIILIFLIAAARGLSARGNPQDDIIKADALIAEKRYDEATRFLREFMAKNVERWDEAQERIRYIDAQKKRSSELVTSLFEAIKKNPEDAETQYAILKQLEAINPESMDDKFKSEYASAVTFRRNLSVFNKIMGEGKALLDKGLFDQAARAYEGGFQLYYDDFEQNKASPVYAEASRLRTEALNRNADQVVTGSVARTSVAVFAEALAAGRWEGLEELWSKASKDLEALAITREGLLAAGNGIARLISSKPDLVPQNSHLPFVWRLLVGRPPAEREGDGAPEGMLAALDGRWAAEMSAIARAASNAGGAAFERGRGLLASGSYVESAAPLKESANLARLGARALSMASRVLAGKQPNAEDAYAKNTVDAVIPLYFELLHRASWAEAAIDLAAALDRGRSASALASSRMAEASSETREARLASLARERSSLDERRSDLSALHARFGGIRETFMAAREGAYLGASFDALGVEASNYIDTGIKDTYASELGAMEAIARYEARDALAAAEAPLPDAGTSGTAVYTALSARREGLALFRDLALDLAQAAEGYAAALSAFADRPRLAEAAALSTASAKALRASAAAGIEAELALFPMAGSSEWAAAAAFDAKIGLEGLGANPAALYEGAQAIAADLAQRNDRLAALDAEIGRIGDAVTAALEKDIPEYASLPAKVVAARNGLIDWRAKLLLSGIAAYERAAKADLGQLATLAKTATSAESYEGAARSLAEGRNRLDGLARELENAIRLAELASTSAPSPNEAFKGLPARAEASRAGLRSAWADMANLELGLASARAKALLAREQGRTERANLASLKRDPSALYASRASLEAGLASARAIMRDLDGSVTALAREAAAKAYPELSSFEAEAEIARKTINASMASAYVESLAVAREAAEADWGDFSSQAKAELAALSEGAAASFDALAATRRSIGSRRDSVEALIAETDTIAAEARAAGRPEFSLVASSASNARDVLSGIFVQAVSLEISLFERTAAADLAGKLDAAFEGLSGDALYARLTQRREALKSAMSRVSSLAAELGSAGRSLASYVAGRPEYAGLPAEVELAGKRLAELYEDAARAELAMIAEASRLDHRTSLSAFAMPTALPGTRAATAEELDSYYRTATASFESLEAYRTRASALASETRAALASYAAQAPAGSASIAGPVAEIGSLLDARMAESLSAGFSGLRTAAEADHAAVLARARAFESSVAASADPEALYRGLSSIRAEIAERRKRIGGLGETLAAARSRWEAQAIGKAEYAAWTAAAPRDIEAVRSLVATQAGLEFDLIALVCERDFQELAARALSFSSGLATSKPEAETAFVTLAAYRAEFEGRALRFEAMKAEIRALESSYASFVSSSASFSVLPGLAGQARGKIDSLISGLKGVDDSASARAAAYRLELLRSSGDLSTAVIELARRRIEGIVPATQAERDASYAQRQRFPALALAALETAAPKIAAISEDYARFTTQFPADRDAAEYRAVLASAAALDGSARAASTEAKRLMDEAKRLISEAARFKEQGDSYMSESRGALNRDLYDYVNASLRQADEAYLNSIDRDYKPELYEAFIRERQTITAENERRRVARVTNEAFDAKEQGIGHYNAGRFEAAAASFKQALDLFAQISVDDANTVFWFGLATNAASATTGTTISPTDPLYEPMSQLLAASRRHYEEGMAFLIQGRRGLAIERFDEARKLIARVRTIFPRNEEAFVLYLRLLYAEDREGPELRSLFSDTIAAARQKVAARAYGEAVADLRPLMQVNPNFTGLKALYDDAVRRNEEAKKLEVSAENKRRADAIIAEARTLISRSSFDAADRRIQDALAIDPTNAAALQAQRELIVKRQDALSRAPAPTSRPSDPQAIPLSPADTRLLANARTFLLNQDYINSLSLANDLKRRYPQDKDVDALYRELARILGL